MQFALTALCSQLIFNVGNIFQGFNISFKWRSKIL
jgi:hypothetical protein